MLNFIIAWIVVLIGIKVYMTTKKINIGINIDVVAILLSLIIVTFLNIIQLIFKVILSLIL